MAENERPTMPRRSVSPTAAHAAELRPNMVMGLASPTVDPKDRSLARLLVQWRIDARYPTAGLQESHKPEWRRAGLGRIVHLVRVHLRDRLEDVVPWLPMPVLVLRGDRDRLLSRRWADELVAHARDGTRRLLDAGPRAAK